MPPPLDRQTLDGKKLFKTMAAGYLSLTADRPWRSPISSRSLQQAKEHIMVTSLILLNIERSRINETAELLADMDGISEVFSVSGSYDLVAIARVPSNEHLADLVTNKLHGLDAIVKSETMLAFKAFSRHNLEAMFEVGM
jgi:DNA-binding Lrp family transcriptional regulator